MGAQQKVVPAYSVSIMHTHLVESFQTHLYTHGSITIEHSIHQTQIITPFTHSKQPLTPYIRIQCNNSNEVKETKSQIKTLNQREQQSEDERSETS